MTAIDWVLDPWPYSPRRASTGTIPMTTHLGELGLDEALAVGALSRRAALDCVDLVAVPEEEDLATIDLHLLAHS